MLFIIFISECVFVCDVWGVHACVRLCVYVYRSVCVFVRLQVRRTCLCISGSYNSVCLSEDDSRLYPGAEWINWDKISQQEH